MSNPDISYRDIFVEVVSRLSRDPHVVHVEEVALDPESAVVHMSVGNADVRLTHPVPQASHFIAECEFGPLPPTHTVAAAQQLLEFNTAAGLAFGIDAETGDVMAVQSIPIAGLNLQDLLAKLLEVGDLAVAWLAAAHSPSNAQGQVPPLRFVDIV